MNIKNRLLNAITAHPKLVTFGIGLAITFSIGIAIGMLDHNQAFASKGLTTGNDKNVNP